MPDLRAMLRVFSPADAIRNVRREVVEHARISADIDALVLRLDAVDAELLPETMEAQLRAS